MLRSESEGVTTPVMKVIADVPTQIGLKPLMNTDEH